MASAAVVMESSYRLAEKFAKPQREVDGEAGGG